MAWGVVDFSKAFLGPRNQPPGGNRAPPPRRNGQRRGVDNLKVHLTCRLSLLKNLLAGKRWCCVQSGRPDSRVDLQAAQNADISVIGERPQTN